MSRQSTLTSVRTLSRGRTFRRIGSVALAGATLLSLSGCENGLQGGASGAALGALAGMGIGSLTGDMGKGAVVGAITGALGGAVLGDQNRRNAEY